MSDTSPAIVPQRAVRRIPRLALWLFGLAYVLPGMVGREPWKGGEIEAFGMMLALAEGQTGFWQLQHWGLGADLQALLPYWIGAGAIMLKPEWMSAALAARLPFTALLGLTLWLTWRASYHLAREPQAQPVAFAFGGEASPKDYACVLADASLLALIASLGLARLSHEAGVWLVQLAGVSLVYAGLAAQPRRPRLAALWVPVGALGLTLSGAPSFAVMVCGLAALLRYLEPPAPESTSNHHGTPQALFLCACAALCAAVASELSLWQWRLELPPATWAHWRDMGRLLIWFTWPVWPLVLWTLWRWRSHWLRQRVSRHLGLPLGLVLLVVLTAFSTPAPQRTLLLALPALATLGAFALPTLRRSMAALIDWFTLLFFSGCALIIWVMWVAMQTGWPPTPARNVRRLVPEFEAVWQTPALWVAALATLAWLGLVFWRVGRHPPVLWKSLVLPAGGAALCWTLLMTLWLPLLDHALSYAPWARKVRAVMQTHSAQPPRCAWSLNLQAGQMIAFHYHAGLSLHAVPAKPKEAGPVCEWALAAPSDTPPPQLASLPGQGAWQRVQTVRRPGDKNERLVLYHRPTP